MEVPDPNLGGIVQYVTRTLNSTCVPAFKLHFLNTTVIVSLMDSVEYTYQGFIQWEASPWDPHLEFWELNRNKHFGSIYFWSDIVSHYVPIITEPFSA